MGNIYVVVTEDFLLRVQCVPTEPGIMKTKANFIT